MKKHLLLIFVATTLGLINYGQSITHIYQFPVAQSSVEVVPGAGEYVLAETIFGGDQYIHFTHYDQSGNIIVGGEKYFGDPNFDEASVDITLNSDKGEYLITSRNRLLFLPPTYVGLTLVDINGNILASRMVQSNHSRYQMLYPMDAVYDPSIKEYVICGTATPGGYDANVDKVAFVMRVDVNLNVTKLMFYDTNPLIQGNEDYDIANRVVLVNNGNYYITGSFSVKNSGALKMGVRNMLINNNLIPIFDIPIAGITDGHLNSVDMIPAIDNTATVNFYVLTNVDDLSGTGGCYYLRIDPFTGNPVTPSNAEMIGDKNMYGYSMHAGNSPNEIVISGMKNKGGEAIPFMTTIDISNPSLGMFMSQIEYNTLVGSSQYWSMGDFYSVTNNGLINNYPLPVYLNNFADREGPGFPYSVVAPVHASSSTQHLSSKYLNVNNQTENFCDDIHFHRNVYATHHFQPSCLTSFFPVGWDYRTTAYIQFPAHSQDVTCGSGQYKPEVTNSIRNLDVNEINVYPNPATTDITIEMGKDYKGKKIQIALYDMAGRKVVAFYDGVFDKEDMQFNLPKELTKGIYFLNVQSKGEKAIQKKITVYR